uniref:Disease resistance N-terminal domain-containing protein n=1 Tax=Oryza sativa subsp. japonica TaxID=39947 RepID=Q6K2I9_ORYSJ|nr:hypothetical protein [Oryza sativa Japonica Group]BAD73853.1 hypothetical protein [Oryza sativa Japonica Group]
MESMPAALRKVGDMPSDQLDEQVKLWARDVRELSYDADDVLDTFMVRERVDDDNHGSKGMVMNKVAGFLRKAKTRHDITDEINGIMDLTSDQPRGGRGTWRARRGPRGSACVGELIC